MTGGFCTNFEAFSHEQLISMLDAADAGSIRATAAQWLDISTTLSEQGDQLRLGLDELQTVWQGAAADMYVSTMSELVTTTSAAAATALHNWSTLLDTADAVDKAKASMPAPYHKSTALEVLAGATAGPVGGALLDAFFNHQAEQQRQQAVGVMQTLASHYDTGQASLQDMPAYQGPPSGLSTREDMTTFSAPSGGGVRTTATPASASGSTYTGGSTSGPGGTSYTGSGPGTHSTSYVAVSGPGAGHTQHSGVIAPSTTGGYTGPTAGGPVVTPPGGVVAPTTPAGVGPVAATLPGAGSVPGDPGVLSLPGGSAGTAGPAVLGGAQGGSVYAGLPAFGRDGGMLPGGGKAGVGGTMRVRGFGGPPAETELIGRGGVIESLPGAEAPFGATTSATSLPGEPGVLGADGEFGDGRPSGTLAEQAGGRGAAGTGFGTGGGAVRSDSSHKRKTWLLEVEDVWGAAVGEPAVLGKDG